MRPRISLCLIARDEEAMLPGCLASVRGAVDEVVLVDTGSRDRTAHLAREAGAHVVAWAWRDDFAAARNEAMSHATGDWILQLDCDERLGPGAGAVLRAEVARKGPPFGLLPLHDAARLDAPPAEVVAGRARLGEPMWLPRLLRRLPDLRWEGVVHESVTTWLVAHGSVARRVAADIIHLGAVPELRTARDKGGRNLSLLERRCAGAPDDVAAAGYLAQEYLAAGRKAEARTLCDRTWAALDGGPGPRRLCLRLATARAILLLEAGESAEALATVRRAAARDGAHPDLSWLAGRALLAQAGGGAAEGAAGAARREAAEAFRAARAARGRVLVDQSLRGTTGWRSALGLGEALLGLGDPAGAGVAFAEALAERPDLVEARLGGADALLEAGNAAEALSRLEPLLGEGPDAWALAAAAAAALGAAADARVLLARAAEREARGCGWVWARARERARGLRAAPGLR